MKDSRLKIYLEILLIVGLCYFPLCYRIDVMAIRQWDEARNAVHTVEMLQSQNFIVRTYNGVPETWEPKPPFLIWLQVASAKIFGLNELAIRFPVMLATFLTVLMLILYFYRYYKNRYVGYLATLVLVTSQGFIDRHIARTGDHDALLILFLSTIILHFYRYLISDKSKKGMLIGIALLFVLSVFTKSIAAFFIIPGLLISTFVLRAGRKLFSDKWFYIAIAGFIMITGSYYMIREFMQPGYLNAVWQWELFPRYANTENKFLAGTFWYYAINFFQSRFTWWIWFLIFAVIALPFMVANEKRRFFFYILINTASLFLILSAGSKNLWYDGPLYPLFAVLIGLFLTEIFKMPDSFGRYFKYIFINSRVFILIIIFFFPYSSIIKKVSRITEDSWDREIYSMGYILRNPNIFNQLPTPLKLVYEGYNAHLLFYVEADNYSKNETRVSLDNFSSVKPGDAVMLSQAQVLDSIERKFNYEIIYAEEPVRVIRITEP